MKKILSLILVFQFLTGCGSESASDQASVAEKRGETSGGIVETNERKERVGLETDAKVKDSLDNGDVNFAANRVSSKAGEANISIASTEPAKVSPQKNGVPAASRAFEAIKDSKTETLPQLDSFPTFPETVLVGDPGNSADVTGYGAVNYAYRIGKFEVTNIEYCEFLNKVAKSDRYRLYDRRMAGVHGGIMRSGRSGDYSYETRVGDGDKPVNYVTWESCARYANWLSSRGGDASLQMGSYQLKGGIHPKVTFPDHASLAVGKSTQWVIASENEWYKAAYYDPAKPGGAGYWPFAVNGGSAPASNLNSNIISAVGAFKVASPYGTYDQNGNLWEYNEARIGNKVGLRGGSFFINDHEGYLRSQTRYEVLSAKWPNYGFRVVALGGKHNGKPSPPAKPKLMKLVLPKRADSMKTQPEAKVSAAPISLSPAARVKARTYYVSQSDGNDDWNGEASLAKDNSGPWKTLARASIEYLPGDILLLKRGDVWHEELRPKGSGTPKQPITISAYGKGSKPVIDRQDYNQDRTGIRLSDQGGFKIVGIEFNRCMTGIYADYSDNGKAREYLWIEDCYFHDSLKYQHYEDYPKRKIGLGVCLFSHERDKRIVMSDITVKNCVFRRLASGFWTN
ncbi:MAG: SUMF1/EgtB/PvdO family nonheme iron enzyme, partial [Opitutae bacterium]|nr:SUMF1/EgtB/PvdO family nonheme iron enzyme [Opitutae bacterium]